jgi:hypothetical protein
VPSVDAAVWRGSLTGASGRKTLAEKKAALKASFNAAYDGGGGGDGGKKKGGYALKDDEPATYYDHLKEDMKERQERSRAELTALDAHTRVQLEGFRAGCYIRLHLTHVPCELSKHFDPCTPLLVGGLLPNEERLGFLQVCGFVERPIFGGTSPGEAMSANLGNMRCPCSFPTNFPFPIPHERCGLCGRSREANVWSPPLSV